MHALWHAPASTHPQHAFRRAQTSRHHAVLQEQRIGELGAEESQSRLIYELEKERVNYVLACYLRTRLHKIQKLALHLEQDEEARVRLSEEVRRRDLARSPRPPPAPATIPCQPGSPPAAEGSRPPSGALPSPRAGGGLPPEVPPHLPRARAARGVGAAERGRAA